MTRGLPRRTVLAVLAGAVAVVALGWALLAALLERDLANEIAAVRRQNETLTLALEEHTARTLRSVDQVLRFIAFEYLDHPDKIELDEFAAAGLLEDELIRLVAVADARGRIVASSRATAATSIAGRAYFAHHREHGDAGVLLSAPSEGLVADLPSIPVSRRISRPDGSFAGVVVVKLNPEYFAAYYGRLDIGNAGVLQLVGTDGIARVRRAGAVTTIGQDMRQSTLMREQAKQASGSYVSTGRLENVPRYIAYRTLADYGLIVAVGTSQQDALASFGRQRLAYQLGGAASALLVLLGSAAALAAVDRRRRVRYDQLREESRLRATFDEAGVGIAHVDLEGMVLKVNPRLCELLGYPASHLVGRAFTDFKFVEDREGAERERLNLLAARGSRHVEARYRHRNAGILWVSLSVATVCDPEGKPEYFVAMAQDITASKAAQQQVEHQATHDLLTGLPNRALFHDRLGHALRQAKRRGSAAAVMFLDLDRFKQVNDRLGHAAGDALLREVATRLAASLRSGDTAARVGGDEFAVVLSEVAQAEDAAAVARRILEAMAAPMSLGGATHSITVSLGIATYPADGHDLDGLVRSADAAMFEAKRAGRNAYRFYRAAPAAALAAREPA